MSKPEPPLEKAGVPLEAHAKSVVFGELRVWHCLTMYSLSTKFPSGVSRSSRQASQPSVKKSAVMAKIE